MQGKLYQKPGGLAILLLIASSAGCVSGPYLFSPSTSRHKAASKTPTPSASTSKAQSSPKPVGKNFANGPSYSEVGYGETSSQSSSAPSWIHLQDIYSFLEMYFKAIAPFATNQKRIEKILDMPFFKKSLLLWAREKSLHVITVDFVEPKGPQKAISHFRMQFIFDYKKVVDDKIPFQTFGKFPLLLKLSELNLRRLNKKLQMWICTSFRKGTSPTPVKGWIKIDKLPGTSSGLMDVEFGKTVSSGSLEVKVKGKVYLMTSEGKILQVNP
ncbi:MAG: hypothetical protein D6805_02020 [Planctomycetota bacterium]|nr:MAG: hypothetical protein D6805_02020 [Planctomycetota bacterium]